jgi:hypothetical protein
MQTTLNPHSPTILSRRKGPPRLPKAVAQEPSSPDTVNLAALAAPKEKSLSKPLLGAMLAASALTALAGPAMAQSPPGLAPLVQPAAEEMIVEDLNFDLWNSEIDLSKEPPFEVASDTTKTKWGVRINSVNDFMPDAWTNWLGGPQHKTPDGTAFDDDGWTAEVQLETNFQNGNDEWVVGGRLAMITQKGSRVPYGEDYEGLRTDLGEFVVQRNFRTELNDRTTLDYGLGGGVQAIGNVGGESLQRWWHETGPAGGRLGDNLQGNQVTDSFRAMPLVTAGAKITYDIQPNLNINATTQVSAPLGRGLGNVGLRAGVGTRQGPFNFEVGGKLDATWADAPELSFHRDSASGIREGLYGRVEYEPGKWGGIYTQLETGGLRNEPVLTFGIRIGGGTSSRLSPFW